MMLGRSLVLFGVVAAVVVRAARFTRSRTTWAGGTLTIVPGAQDVTAREDELDHEERGCDAGSTTIRHD